MKNLIFTVFFIIERWFFKGIHRKNKKVKTVFASILIPKCVFSKTKMQNILNHRIQFITKIMIFRKIKKSCNTKTLWKQFRTFWFFTRFDPITHLQYHIKKFGKNVKNYIFSINAFENHYPGTLQVLIKSPCGPFSSVVCVLWRVTVVWIVHCVLYGERTL